jgi:two-component system cell cycle response regulator
LTKPIDEIALLARVRSLSRLKLAVDELRARASTSAALGIPSTPPQRLDGGLGGKILLVDDRAPSRERVVAALSASHEVDVEPDPLEALPRAAENDYELVIVSLGLARFDGLRLCSQLRALERTRHTPLLMLADGEDRPRILRGLDLGVNDYLIRPIDRNELIARVRTQIRLKRYADELRSNVQAAMELAVVDPLTGLHNRRYLESHLLALLEQAARTGRPLSAMILDIDHFKRVNDSFGHDCGDEVLKTFAARVKRAVRGADLMCRFGGEEFVVVMPDAKLSIARIVAERIREAVASAPFPIERGARAIPVTVSIGIAGSGPGDTPDALFKRADRALYASKNSGRNRVTASAA